MIFQTRLIPLAAAVAALILPAAADPAVPPFAEWGKESLAAVRRDLWLPDQKLYAEKFDPRTGKPDHVSFMWGVGVQLSALAAAAAVQPEPYLQEARSYADAIQVYWHEHDGIEGFDVQPVPKPADRYYDDNAWLVLALAEVHELTKDKVYLDRAEATFRFVLSGGDDKLGGGLYWREQEKTSKNTCTNAPAIVSALRLHQLTGNKKHLETALRLDAWTKKTLQDSEDGLYFDNVRLDGKIDRRKFTYNSALMIRANCLFHEITGEKERLEEAQRIARAAEKQWVSADGSVADSGQFAHLLLEAFLELRNRDKDPRWDELVTRCLVNLHDRLKDEHGRYPHRWDRGGNRWRRTPMLLSQASPARIYWLAAREIPAR